MVLQRIIGIALAVITALSSILLSPGPRSLCDELGLTAEKGFVLDNALAAEQEHLKRPGVLGNQDAGKLVEQAMQACGDVFRSKVSDSRQEALFQAYSILSNRKRREMYDACFVPVFRARNPPARLRELCQWEV
ncbi:hypothetical protein QBC39DRAFT_335060 [Podospora conica]|nr:hypothetical protein QBC39DRAFT_335060 [Schizothecium conicum]